MGDDERLHLQVRAHGPAVELALTGELDLRSGMALRTVLAALEGSVPEVCVDLTGLSFIDPSGLRILLDAHRQLAPGGEVYVRCAPGSVRRVFEVSGVDQVLRVVDAAQPSVA